MNKSKPHELSSNDLILQHFILSIIIFSEALVGVLNLIVPSPKNARNLIQENDYRKRTNRNKDIQLSKEILSRKSNDELKQILNEVDLLSNISTKGLTKLIISNNEALNLLKLEHRRDSLKKMTNEEIRSLLKGYKGISRLKKTELIELVIKESKLNQPSKA